MGYETIDVPQGAYIGWGDRPGQVVEGRVTDYDPVGGTDFGGDQCPQLEIEVNRTVHSYSRKENAWTAYEAGEVVNVTCGQVQLKKKVRKAQPRIGDMIRIELADLIRTPNGTVKSFVVQIDRSGGGGGSTRAAASAPADSGPGPDFGAGAPSNDPWGGVPPVGDDDAPPF